jgi:hypothetical protein
LSSGCVTHFCFFINDEQAPIVKECDARGDEPGATAGNKKTISIYSHEEAGIPVTSHANRILATAPYTDASIQ